MDQLVHTWDLAVATGKERMLDPELVEAVVATFLPHVPDVGRSAGIVGPAIALPTTRHRRTACSQPWGGNRDRPILVGRRRPAMGHPGRRAMLRAARDGEISASVLASVAGLSPSAASPHLELLRDVGLMHERVDARRRLYRVDLERLSEVRAALDELWGEGLEAEPEPVRRRSRART